MTSGYGLFLGLVMTFLNESFIFPCHSLNRRLSFCPKVLWVWGVKFHSAEKERPLQNQKLAEFLCLHLISATYIFILKGQKVTKALSTDSHGSQTSQELSVTLADQESLIVLYQTKIIWTYWESGISFKFFPPSKEGFSLASISSVD